MNRPIKFRGRCSKQSAYSGEWVTGSLIIPDEIENNEVLIMHAISDSALMKYHVDVHTIGQFTGLYDKNGKEIYEGDIILYGGSIQHEVVFRHGAFGYLIYGGEFISYAGNTNFTFNPLNRSKKHEVIGNIYGNPELIEKIE